MAMNEEQFFNMDIIGSVLDPYFAIAGLFGIPIAAFIVGYTIFNLCKSYRFINLFVFLIFLGLFFFPAGRYLIGAIAITIITINNCFYFFYFINSFFTKKIESLPLDESLPAISILIPAKNEETVIKDTLLAISRLKYPVTKLEVVLIDDQCTDKTIEICQNLAKEMPYLRILHNQLPKGKSKSLNDAVATISNNYFLILDADHHIEENFIQTALPHFKDPSVCCVQSANTIRNYKKNLLSICVDMEFLGRFKSCYPGRKTAFFMGSGGIFKTEDFRNIGGFNPEMLTEDLEISFRLYDVGKRIVYDGSISTHELAVENFKSFYKQRHRWLRGIWQSFALHFNKTIKPSKYFNKVRIPFIHFMIECFSLPLLLTLCVLYAFNFFGIIDFQFKLLMYVTTLMSVIVFDAGYIRGKRYYLLILGPILLFYMLLYALPSSVAWIDNVLLKKPYVWIKTIRPGESKNEKSDNTMVNPALAMVKNKETNF